MPVRSDCGMGSRPGLHTLSALLPVLYKPSLLFKCDKDRPLTGVWWHFCNASPRKTEADLGLGCLVTLQCLLNLPKDISSLT